MNSQIFLVLLSCGLSIIHATYVSPVHFLSVNTFQGTWINEVDLALMDADALLFEGGWVREGHNLIVTNVCRARRASQGGSGPSVVPGELLDGTCYVSGKPTLSALTGVSEFREFDVLLKMKDEIYDWVPFGDHGEIPAGAVIGGIRGSFEPLLICRKVFNGTAGNIRASKAVLGNFSPRDGKCYYELEFGTNWIKFDLSFTSEHFQLLVLQARGKPACAEPRGPVDIEADEAKPHFVTSHKLP